MGKLFNFNISFKRCWYLFAMEGYNTTVVFRLRQLLRLPIHVTPVQTDIVGENEINAHRVKPCHIYTVIGGGQYNF